MERTFTADTLILALPPDRWTHGLEGSASLQLGVLNLARSLSDSANNIMGFQGLWDMATQLWVFLIA